MATKSSSEQSYAALASYHNALVQTRFSVAALYMTAAAFLVSAYFGDTSKWQGHAVLIPLLGLVLTLSAWFMEMRTEALLANLVERGKAVESRIEVAEEDGFFQLMSRPQPLGVRIPFIRRRIDNGNAVVRYLTSHTLWLEVVYVAFLAFWINAAIVSS